MHVGRKNEAHTYYMDGKPLLHTFEEKDVGVMITENSKPNKQGNEAYRKAMNVLGQITHAFHFRNRHVFKNCMCNMYDCT